VLALIIAVAVAQTPPKIAVVLSGRSGMSEARGQQIAQKVADWLTEANVDIERGPKEATQALTAMGTKPSECQGKRPCVSGLGRVLRVWSVVGVEVADLDGTVAVHVEMVDSENAEKLAEADVVSASKKIDQELGEKLNASLPAFKNAIAAALKPAPTPAAPVKAEPVAIAAPPPVPERRVSIPGVISVSLAGAAAITAVIFLVRASLSRGEFEALRTTVDGRAAINLTQGQASSLAAGANTSFTVSLITGIAAAALALLGGILLGAGT
jgi:hypothetical protein